MKQYVFDTFALFAYIENEEGADEVEALLQKALDDEIEVAISTVSCIEVFYVTRQEQGEKVAMERLKLLDDLMIVQEPVDRRLAGIIGEIKATKAMSFADSCIAGLAKSRKATLVHKDPEYEQIEKEIKQVKLPYKQKKRKTTLGKYIVLKRKLKR
jgi:predicted nucleic acid-binding protein